MMKNLPLGAQWMDDKEFDGLFDGEMYSMGWRTGDDGKMRFMIDVADDVWLDKRRLRRESMSFKHLGAL